MKNNSDYEIEIRHMIWEIEGKSCFEHIPEHVQSRVTGWKENE